MFLDLIIFKQKITHVNKYVYVNLAFRKQLTHIKFYQYRGLEVNILVNSAVKEKCIDFFLKHEVNDLRWPTVGMQSQEREINGE